jgi:energy-coupling factor transport system permease protein
MKRISPLAYVPRRGTLQTASLAPVAVYLGAYLAVCFLSSDPIVLVSATAGAALAGYGCQADRAVRFSIRLGLFLALTMIVVNGLVTSRGATVVARLGEWPVLGRVDLTGEAFAAGAVIGLRALGTMVVIGVYSACVDPDRVLHAVHRVARRSALTASLISRLVPLASADQARLSEAAGLRGPGANPVGRLVLAQRLLGGSLDRAVDVAATLELRGYGRGGSGAAPRTVRSRYDRRFWIAGVLLAGAALLSLITGSGFSAYPRVEYSPDAFSLSIAAMFVAGGMVTWRSGGRARGGGG